MFALTKLWIDSGSGPEAITYVFTEPGVAPGWEGDEDTDLMMPVAGADPALRRAIIEIPRYLGGRDRFLLHYRFGRGGRHRKRTSARFPHENCPPPDQDLER